MTIINLISSRTMLQVATLQFSRSKEGGEKDKRTIVNFRYDWLTIYLPKWLNSSFYFIFNWCTTVFFKHIFTYENISVINIYFSAILMLSYIDKCLKWDKILKWIIFIFILNYFTVNVLRKHKIFVGIDKITIIYLSDITYTLLISTN